MAKAMRLSSFGGLMVLPAVLWVLAFMVLPILTLVPGSLTGAEGQWSFEHYAKFLSDAFYLVILGKTMLWAAVITLICIAVSFPIAVYLTRVSAKKRNWIILTLMAPMVISLVIRNYGWFILLADRGWFVQHLRMIGIDLRILFSPSAVLLAMVHASLAYMVIAIMGALEKIPANVMRAAEGMGASRLRSFVSITLPLSLPGLVAGSAIVFSLSAASFVTPEIMGGSRVKFMGSLIFQQFTSTLDYAAGAAMGLILSLATLISLGLFILVLQLVKLGKKL